MRVAADDSFAYTDGVVVNSGGVTTFYVARSAIAPDAAHVPAVLTSADGAAWTIAGNGFPTTGVGNFVLAVQPNNANLVYALIPDWTDTVGSLWRLDLPDAQWRAVAGLPPLFNGQPPRCCAVDPVNANLIFVASVLIYRCAVTMTGSGATRAYAMTSDDVTAGQHVDFHRLRYAGLDSNTLWAGNDGGTFVSTDAATATTWQSRNAGLATVQAHTLDVHPTQDAVTFIATQDNGTIRSFGDEVWFGMTNMDGSWIVINWADPYKILTGTAYEAAMRATDGAATFTSWENVSLPVGTFDGLLVPSAATTRPDPGNPGDANIVGVGSRAVWLTRDFATHWNSIPNGDAGDELPAGDVFTGLVFAGADRVFALSYRGVARRYDFDGTAWHVTDLAPPAAAGTFAGIALDYNDPARQSVYVTLYGSATFERVWHFDGTTWSVRSGPAEGDPAAIPTALINAIMTDPNHPSDVYIGCDVGVWRSRNGGTTWAPLNDALPQAPVTSLKIHPAFPTLYAAVYGRGVFEYDLSGAPTPAAQVYIRDTLWDTGKRPTVDGLTAPDDRTRHLYHWDGPDIRVDAPAADGSYQFPAGITPYDFIVSLVDESGSTETADPSAPVVVNRVYVRVHNRGSSAVTDARLTLLLAPASPGLPDLPPGYANTVQTGAPLGSSPWRLVGAQTLPPVAAGAPVVAQFDLPSTMLPPPAMLPGSSHYCLLAMVHSPALDAFLSAEQHVDTLTTHDRKAANKNLNVVPMASAGGGGTAPHLISSWLPVWINGSSRGLGALRLDTRTVKGFVDLVLPKELIARHPQSRRIVPNADALSAWKEAATRSHAWLSQHEARGRYDAHFTKQTRQHLERVLHGGATALRVPSSSVATLLEPLHLKPDERHVFYMRFVLSQHAETAGRVVHLFHEGKPFGGITYELRTPAGLRERELNTEPGFHRTARTNAKIV